MEVSYELHTSPTLYGRSRESHYGRSGRNGF